MQKKQLNLSQSEALIKAANYCAYQERCHNEVINKLAEWGIYGLNADQILAQLIQQNYLNEERFAKAFAGGKFRVKNWGRLKIKRELKIRGISDYCIKLGLSEIEEEDYLSVLKDLIQERKKAYHGKPDFEINRKVYHYLATKGFEGDLILDFLKKV